MSDASLHKCSKALTLGMGMKAGPVSSQAQLHILPKPLALTNDPLLLQSLALLTGLQAHGIFLSGANFCSLDFLITVSTWLSR